MARGWWRRFAVRGVFWRQYLDFGLTNVPFYLRPVMIFFWTIFFYFFAAPARRAILSNLKVVLPGSNPLLNQARIWLTLYNFAWTIADAADHKLAQTEFAYEVEGDEFSSNWRRRTAPFSSPRTWGATTSERWFLICWLSSRMMNCQSTFSSSFKSCRAVW